MDRLRVLIVEDDRTSRFILFSKLQAAGYEPLIAWDPQSAVHVASRQRPHLVILDLGLPRGDGFDVMRHPAIQSLPVLILTGREDKETRRRAFEAGAVAFLTKPVDGPKLLAVMRKILDQREESESRKAS